LNMKFANGIDKKLLPKNILILNSRRKWNTLVEFCLKYDINFKMFEKESQHYNISKKLKPYTTYLPEEKLYDPQYYIKTLDFEPEYIMNCRDEYPITKVEYDLNLWYNTKTQFDERALKFFTSKKEQDRVCKLMGIPTLDEGRYDDKILVKLDEGKSGGGTGYKIIEDKRNYIPKKNDFIQRYINIDYGCNQHSLVDNNGDYHIYHHDIGKFGVGDIIPNNVAYMYLYPFPYFSKEDIAIVEKFYTKLKEHITVKNRIFYSEFFRERNGKLYFQEFNSRPSGEFESGTFDWNSGKFNTLVDYFTNNVQEEIEYYQQTVEIYLENINKKCLFAPGIQDGMKKTPIPFKQKIKVFNTKIK